MRMNEQKFLILMARKMYKMKDLAEVTGLSRATLSYIKGGKRCNVVVAGKIAKALDVDVENLFEVEIIR